MPSVNWITQAVFSWVSQDAGVFLPDAFIILKAFAVVLLVVYGLRLAGSAFGGGEDAVWGTMRTLFVIWLATYLLRHYNSPLPWAGVSVHQFFPEGARDLAAKLDNRSLNTAIGALDNVTSGLVEPTFPWHPIEVLAYIIDVIGVWLMQGVMFALTSVGWVAIGIGVVLGPLSIPCLLFERTATLFWAWINFMVSWSFFQVVAQAFVSIWSGAILFALNQLFHGNYTAIQTIVLLKALILLMAAFVWSALQVERYASSLYGQAVAAASGYGQFLKGTVL